MSLFSRRRLLYAALILLLALDLLGLSAFVYAQGFGVEAPQVWVLATVVVLALWPLLVRLANAVFATAEPGRIVPEMGENIP